MGKAEYFEGKGLKGKFKKWWFTSVGVFPCGPFWRLEVVLGALEHAREIIESGELFGIHVGGTRSPDGRLYKGHTGAARLALRPVARSSPPQSSGRASIQKPGVSSPAKARARRLRHTDRCGRRRRPTR